MIETEKHHRAKTFEFKVKNLSEGDIAGMGRVGVFADISLLIDGDEVISQEFEMTGTVANFDNAIGVLCKFESIEEIEPFVCTCGDTGCAYIEWDMHRSNGRILIKMENLLGDPIGKHFYSIPKRTFLRAFLSLFDTVCRYMEENNIVAYHYPSRLTSENIRQMRENISELL